MRAPLRVALNFLRDDAALKFESVGSELLRDPWAARNEYVEVLLDPRGGASFLTRNAVRQLSDLEESRVWKLLEMQRDVSNVFLGGIADEHEVI